MRIEGTNLIGVHIYIGVTMCCLMITLVPYISSKNIYDQNLIEILKYDFTILPLIMTFSFAVPLLLSVFTLTILILALLKVVSDKQYLLSCIGLVVTMFLTLVAGYVISGQIYWLFIAIFPMVGAIMSF